MHANLAQVPFPRSHPFRVGKTLAEEEYKQGTLRKGQKKWILIIIKLV